MLGAADELGMRLNNRPSFSRIVDGQNSPDHSTDAFLCESIHCVLQKSGKSFKYEAKASGQLG